MPLTAPGRRLPTSPARWALSPGTIAEELAGGTSPGRHCRCMREPHVAREPATGPRIGGHSRCVTGTCGPQSPQGRSCPRQRRRARARSEAASRRHRATNRLARIPRPSSCRYERHCVPQRTVGFPLRGLHRVAPVAQLRRRPRPQRRRLRAAARRANPGASTSRKPSPHWMPIPCPGFPQPAPSPKACSPPTA